MRYIIVLLLVTTLTLVSSCGTVEVPVISPTVTPTNTPLAATASTVAPTIEPTAMATATPTPEPTNTPEPTATSTPTEVPATPTIDALRYPVSVEQDRGGVILRITKVSLTELDKLPADVQESLLAQEAWANTRTLVALAVEVENTTDVIANVFPDQGTIIVGSEQVPVDIWQSDHIGGEIYPGVIKEGQLVAPLKRSNRQDVTKVVLLAHGPWDAKTMDRLGENYELLVELDQ